MLPLALLFRLSIMRLITIPFSHYNERARWALQRFGVDFVEHGYVPVLHFGGVAWHTGLRGGRSDRASTPLSTPVLVTDDGERLRDSGQIVRYVCDRYATPETTLYPAALRTEIEALERRAHDHIGPHTRRLVYRYLLTEPRAFRAVVIPTVGRAQGWAFRVLRPVISVVLRRALGITESRARRSLQRLREEVAALSEELAGRPYLQGDRFTAADLTMASLLAPVLLPPTYGVTLPALKTLPAELQEVIQEIRATPIGAHCVRMYVEERRTRVESKPDE